MMNTWPSLGTPSRVFEAALAEPAVPRPSPAVPAVSTTAESTIRRHAERHLTPMSPARLHLTDVPSPPLGPGPARSLTIPLRGWAPQGGAWPRPCERPEVLVVGV